MHASALTPNRFLKVQVGRTYSEVYYHSIYLYMTEEDELITADVVAGANVFVLEPLTPPLLPGPLTTVATL